MKAYLGLYEWRQRRLGVGDFGWRMPAGATHAIDLRGKAERESPGLAIPTQRVLFFCPDDVSLLPPHRQIASAPGETLSARNRDDLRAIFGSPSTGQTTLDRLLWELMSLHYDATGVDRPCPILPGHDGNLELIVGGVMARRLRIGHGADEWGACAEMIGREYRRIHALEQLGACPPDLGARYLGVQERKYGLTRTQARDLVPQDLPRREPVEPRTTYTESFTGTADPIGSDLTWTEVSGTWDRSSDRGRHTSAGGTDSARAEHDVSSTDHETQCEQHTTSGGVYAGPTARHSSSAFTCYSLVAELTINDYYCTRREAGSGTDIITSELSGSISAGTVDKVTCNGSTIEIFQGVNSRGSTTDTVIAGGTRGGLNCFSSTGIWDNWSITDLGGGASGIPRIVHHRKMQGAA